MGALLDEYLWTLPRGAESYPECMAKGSLVRAYLQDKPVEPDASTPPSVRAAIEKPVLAASWVPEVTFLSIALLVREQFFADDDAFLRWVKELNAQLFESALYRVLMLVASTRILIPGATRRWVQFHRGTELIAEHGDGPFAELAFNYPIRLFNELHVRLFAMACMAAIEAAGGKQCRITSCAVRTHAALVRVHWQGRP